MPTEPEPALGPPGRRRRAIARLTAAFVVLALLAPVTPPLPARAADLPPGFSDDVVFSGLTQPIAIRFSPDGRIFVAEKRGIIKVFDDTTDTTPDTFVDLRTEVYNYWDRGLLGMALHPDFPATPYVYALYTRDAPPGETPPYWGQPDTNADPCPTPPGPTASGCVASGRLARLTASGNAATEIVPLITDWCQQFPSHSVGDLAFGKDGALYVSAGDGASFNFTDYGQRGDPLNPCGDPPGGVGAVLEPPAAEGGALRAQDLRTSGDPVTLSGTLIRVDPLTGAALPTNPNAGARSANARRIVAHGLKNPFRITVRPGTSEVWMGEVGWSRWDEIDRFTGGTTSVQNFGWPCYEGQIRQPSYDNANLTICEDLYDDGSAKGPYLTYHVDQPVADETCSHTNGSAPAGIAFYPRQGGTYPADYAGALFFADYSRDCIFVMRRGSNGLPDRSTLAAFRNGAANPVHLVVGPDGALWYVDFSGSVRRISYTPGNQPPVAQLLAEPMEGPIPLTVQFDASGSTDADGDPLTYRWDLDGDGTFDAPTADATAEHTYTEMGVHQAAVEVSDGAGGVDVAAVAIEAGTSPTAAITKPVASRLWAVGDAIVFRGTASDVEDGTLPASAFDWELILHHCPSDPSSCHEHPVQQWSGVRTASFVAPDHAYPAHLELLLTVTDSHGLTTSLSRLLQPRTVKLSFETRPRRFPVVVGSADARKTRFSRTFIIGSSVTISAPARRTRDGVTYRFRRWSDGGARTHEIVAPDAPTTYVARYRVVDA